MKWTPSDVYHELLCRLQPAHSTIICRPVKVLENDGGNIGRLILCQTSGVWILRWTVQSVILNEGGLAP